MKKILSVTLLLILIMQSMSVSFAVTEENDGVQTLNEDTDYVYTPMELSQFAVEMIKSFEGFYPTARWDYSQWSIGYGSFCGEDKNVFPEEYADGITEVQATELLVNELVDHVKAVNKFIKNYALTLTQNQFDALVSFSYNCGSGVWTWSTDNFEIKRLLLSGSWTETEMTNAFLKWVKAGGEVLAGLVRRRTREAALFNSSLNIQSPSVKYYYVSVTSGDLNVRKGPSTSTASLGYAKNTVILPITEFSSDGKWAFTPYAAFFGWVNTDYIKPIETALELGESMIDAQGVKYTLGSDYKTIVVGVPNSDDKGNAMYDGIGNGNVYLNRYVKVGEYVYQLSEICPNAFYANETLKTIYIPDSVKKIADNAFTGSYLKTVYCSSSSYAATYAKAHNIEHMEYECRNGHDVDTENWKVVRERDCEFDGLEGLCCRVCGYVSETRIYAKATGHSYVDGKWQTVSELSCTTDHVEGVLCENCKKPRETRTVEKSSGHTYTEGKWETLTEASCTENGSEAIICTVCNGHVDERIVRMYGHSEGDWEVISTVSCTTNGVRIIRCTTCKEMIAEEITEAHHTYDSSKWVTTVVPTCTAAGEKAILCEVCESKVQTKTVSATGHSYKSWYVKTAPTYKKTGVERRDCKNCSSYETRTIAKLAVKIVTDTLKLNDTAKRLEGITVGTKVSDIVSQIKNSADVKILDKNGKKLASDSYVGSGARLVLFEGSSTLLSYTINVKGDADGNGLANDWDCILLGRYLAGWKVDICTEALDFDNNGTVNDWDEILFSRYLANWEIELW